MWEFIYQNLIFIYILELGAALAGTYYLKKVNDIEWETKVLVYYLWFVIFVETIGLYPLYAYFTNYETLPFIKDTPWERNYWWYNIYHLVKFVSLFYYFICKLRSASKRKIFTAVGAVYVCCSILYLIFSGEFFFQYSLFDAIIGTLLLVILILFFYTELLQSEEFLVFYKSLPFYISMGLLVWHLVITPLFIYSIYFTRKSPEFVNLNGIVLGLANLFLYGMMIAGFLICSKQEIKNEDRSAPTGKSL